MKKKYKIGIALLILIILAILLFFSLNYALFNKKMDILKDAKEACEGLKVGDSCEFYFDGNLTSGVCEKIRKEKIICKTETLKKYFPASMHKD